MVFVRIALILERRERESGGGGEEGGACRVKDRYEAGVDGDLGCGTPSQKQIIRSGSNSTGHLS